MLIKFAVKNYRGFADKIEWDLSHPRIYSFNPGAIKDGVVKNGIIYGPNGSGKTNLGLAIFDIANHLSHKWKKPNYYLNYASAYNYKSPVEFEYTFKFGDNIFNYNYSKVSRDLKGVLVAEHLLLDGKELLYKSGKDLRIADEFALTKVALDNIKKSANNLSIVNYLLGAVPLPKNHALIKLRDFVENMLFFRSLDNREFIGLKEGGSNIEEYIIQYNLAEDFAAFLKETSNQDYKFAQPSPGENMLYCVMGGVRIPFLWVASTGTLNLELQYYWLKEMVNAPFVFIDEFDAFYHHELSRMVINKLKEAGVQFVVTTHNTSIMSNDLMRPDCYFLMNSSRILPLPKCTEKELREAHNIEKIYKAGAFYVEQ